MANAVAAIEEEPEEQQAMSVTFTEQGSLGLKFTPNKQTGNTEVLAVNPGTQAERHRQLRGGLILKTVGGAGVMGRPAETLGMLKAAGRPVTPKRNAYPSSKKWSRMAPWRAWKRL